MNAPSTQLDLALPDVVTREEWQAAHQELLTREKARTAARDDLVALRRRMPMMRVEAGYRFEGSDGEMRLLDLFEGRRQLIVYRFFYDPDVEGWPEAGCDGVNARGVGTAGHALTFLDLTPLGRQEHREDSPPGRPQGEPYQWWRRHDEYGRP